METNYGIGTGSYANEREGWRFLELTAVLEPLFETLPAFLAQRGELLDGFDRVSLHAPIWAEAPARLVDAIAGLPLDGDVIFHPDAWADERALDRLGARVVFENMDVGKRSGRTVEDLSRVFAGHIDAGFCLDVAHVWTNDPSLRLGHDLLDALGDRLRQLHVSGIERDGSHRPTTQADLELYRPLLERCEAVPWILETVIE